VLSSYIHCEKWYEEEFYEAMKANDYVVDHMDNNGYNCCIENLCFLTSDENKAKGMAVDKLSREKMHIAVWLLFSSVKKQMRMKIALIERSLATQYSTKVVGTIFGVPFHLLHSVAH